MKGNKLVADWAGFFGQLFVKYRDGYVITPNAANNNCGCNVGNGAYPSAWYERIVEDTGDHYKVPAGHDGILTSKGLAEHKTVNKLNLLKRK